MVGKEVPSSLPSAYAYEWSNSSISIGQGRLAIPLFSLSSPTDTESRDARKVSPSESDSRSAPCFLALLRMSSHWHQRSNEMRLTSLVSLVELALARLTKFHAEDGLRVSFSKVGRTVRVSRVNKACMDSPRE